MDDGQRSDIPEKHGAVGYLVDSLANWVVINTLTFTTSSKEAHTTETCGAKNNFPLPMNVVG